MEMVLDVDKSQWDVHSLRQIMQRITMVKCRDIDSVGVFPAKGVYLVETTDDGNKWLVVVTNDDGTRLHSHFFLLSESQFKVLAKDKA